MDYKYNYQDVSRFGTALVKVTTEESTESKFTIENAFGNEPNTIRGVQLKYIMNNELELSDKERGYKISKDFTPYHKVVLDSIYTLIVNDLMITATEYDTMFMQEREYKYFTPEMIIRIGMGGDNKISISPERVEEMYKTILSLSRMECMLSKPIEKKVKSDNSNVVSIIEDKGYLIDVKPVTVKLKNGRSVRGFKLICSPILLDYLLRSHRLASIPSELFLPIKGVNQNSEFNTIRAYIIQRIAGMKNKNNALKNKNITYDYINSEGKKAGLINDLMLLQNNNSSSAIANKKSKIHKDVCNVLDCLIANKYITGYEVIKKDKKIYGVTIKFKK